MAEKIADPAKADLRASIAAEMTKAEASAPADDDAPAGEPSTEAVEEAAAAVTEAAEPEAEAPPEPKVARGFAELAKREGEDRRRFEARKAELQGIEQQLRGGAEQMRAQMRAELETEMRQAFVSDPVGFAKTRIGLKQGFKDVGAQFYYEELGNDAPPEIREKRHVYGIQRSVEELRRDVENDRAKLVVREQQMEATRMVNEYRAGIVASLPKLPASAKYLGRLAAANPNQAADVMLSAANEYVRVNPGQVPTPQVLAQLVEKALQERLQPFLGTKTTSPEADETDTAPTTLTNHHSGRTPSKTAPKSRDERRADLLRELESGKGSAD